MFYEDGGTIDAGGWVRVESILQGELAGLTGWNSLWIVRSFSTTFQISGKLTKQRGQFEHFGILVAVRDMDRI